jgi:hypothetical protein
MGLPAFRRSLRAALRPALGRIPNDFGGAPARRRLLSCALWPAYWGGQVLILWALLP